MPRLKNFISSAAEDNLCSVFVRWLLEEILTKQSKKYFALGAYRGLLLPALDVLNSPKPLKRSPGILKFSAAAVSPSVDFTCLLQNKRGRAFVIWSENPPENDGDPRCVSAFWVTATRLLQAAEVAAAAALRVFDDQMNKRPIR